MTNVLPNLGANGWVTDPAMLVPNLLAEMMVSDYSQSTIYNSNVTSIAWLVAKYQNNSMNLASKLENAIGVCYRRYFPSGVDVSVTVNTPEPTNGKYTISLSVVVMVNGIEYSVAKLANVENGILKNTIEEINK